jgi:hypothetical protein
MFFQVIVLIVISQLYRSIAGAVRVPSQTVTHHTMTSAFISVTTPVPEFLT